MSLSYFSSTTACQGNFITKDFITSDLYYEICKIFRTPFMQKS